MAFIFNELLTLVWMIPLKCKLHLDFGSLWLAICKIVENNVVVSEVPTFAF